MTILGHDVNGRPLRAGDRVVLISAKNPDFKADIGRAFTVRKACQDFPVSVCCDEVLGDGTPPERYSLAAHSTRRIDDCTDHQPSEYTFDSLMGHLKSGVPA